MRQTGEHARQQGQIKEMGAVCFLFLSGLQLGDDLVITLDLLLLGGGESVSVCVLKGYPIVPGP